jgi:hypothetical protein
MSKEILEKLKNKPIPEKIPMINVAIKKPAEKEDVKVKTKIVDKRETSKIDREFILNKLKNKGEIQTIKPLETKIVSKKQDSESKEKYSQDEQKTVITKKKKIKKLKLQTDLPEIKETERKTILPTETIIEGKESLLDIDDIKSRLPEKEKKVLIRASSYYMNNREIFINFISSLFEPYKEEISKDKGVISCDSKNSEFTLLTHQKIIRDYINLYTPYRGVLLFHGLGSGKTCSSIAIAEGIKTENQIIVMTPASLRVNYIEELKKCGDKIYKKNQFWEFIDIIKSPELIEPLSQALSIPIEYIKKQGGAWLVNVKKSSNFESLSTTEKLSLDYQINEMIRIKYKFINYNGLRKSHIEQLTQGDTINPFTNKTIIIDEAHNFVSRIVNKIKSPNSISMQLYNFLMTAENSRIVLLTGTPIINYPNEIAILFNILRGKIKTWYIKLSINDKRKISQDSIKEIFKTNFILKNVVDYIKYKPTSTTLEITRNPFGFINNYDPENDKYKGVNVDNYGNIDDDSLMREIVNVLKEHNISIVTNSTKVQLYDALPDKLEDFSKYFIDENNKVKNMNLFKRRILGLTSYFPDIDALLPEYKKSTDFIVKKIPMSNFQFGIYEEARVQERKLELNNAKKKKQGQGKENIYEDSVSTYRIFSRAFCNFVFPKPNIIRPLPRDGDDLSSAIIDDNPNENILDAHIPNPDEFNNEIENIDEKDGKNIDETLIKYEDRIINALKKLEDNSDKYLTPDALEIYSPKFLNILENLQDKDLTGLHLIYSQFRTLEGIGILSLILKANGFAQFKIVKTDKWIIDIDPSDYGKPKFVLYTGTESAEEKEYIRNIFNSNWENIPNSLREELEKISSNNYYGEIIKTIMITASGAEGISLENVRYVHITEPYWHPVRTQQVIGRARRICSHKNLEKKLQTVKVFMYLMTFSEEQLDSDRSIELRLKDKSKKDGTTPLTSDEALYEISTIKEEINKELLVAIKESSIDCSIHTSSENKEGLQCFTFSSGDPEKFSSTPSMTDEESDVIGNVNKQEIKWKAVKVTIEGISYALNKETGDVYDLDSYKRKNPILVGTLEIENGKYKFKRI